MTGVVDTSTGQIAPIQLVVIAFEGDHFHGQIRAELQRLRDRGMVRLVGLVAVRKDAAGAITVIEETDLDSDSTELFARLGSGTIGAAAGPPTGASVFGYAESDIRRIA